MELDIPEDDARNPATIADNVGDNVGDIAGMGSDLFGSFAESTASALVLSSVSSMGQNHQWSAMCYPIMLSALSIGAMPGGMCYMPVSMVRCTHLLYH